jgi:hypothetical protein
MSILQFHIKDAAVNPDVVLQKAIGQYESVIVMGWNNDGALDARASLNLSCSDVLWITSVFTNKLLNGDYSKDVR